MAKQCTALVLKAWAVSPCDSSSQCPLDLAGSDVMALLMPRPLLLNLHLSDGSWRAKTPGRCPVITLRLPGTSQRRNVLSALLLALAPLYLPLEGTEVTFKTNSFLVGIVPPHRNEAEEVSRWVSLRGHCEGTQGSLCRASIELMTHRVDACALNTANHIQIT
ncbi:hypothetical protein EYF80_036787 [Liparis tanakae]|uniref:Uncharacterized protein n=1 Tax=Liparis tanakae TaxID=230148 RepID=A0A4Z2GHG3_9TELE|nr:hypothetical protein EYF80_036787 [Liparis tanakae]